MPIGRLHVLTDYYFQQRFSHAALAAQALAGGAEVIQFRAKHGDLRHRHHEAVRTAAACAEAGGTLLVNDRLDLALAVGAAGVHLGQADLPVAAARRVLGPDAVIGATATTIAEALRAQDDGASYIGFGPVYPTRSKANPASVKGLDGLADVCAAVSVPVIAIAGITVARVPEVLAAGAHGIAVMSAVTLADDPRAATAAFREALDAARR